MSRVIIKINENAPPEAFSNFRLFFVKYPEMIDKKHKINYQMRIFKPYKADKFTIYRINLNQ